MTAETIVKQTGRFLTIESPLGADALILTGFEGVEALSRPFSYRLELVSPNEAIDPADILGKGVTVGVGRADQAKRLFHGVVKQFAAGGRYARGYRTYYAELAPWLWFLTR